MSLNRYEQTTYDYLHTQPEEIRHWREVVRHEVKTAADIHQAAAVLDRALWRYFEERASVTEPFRGLAHREGLTRLSMRNLAELLIRLWAPPPAKSLAQSRRA